jgi:hypothetical protein
MNPNPTPETLALVAEQRRSREAAAACRRLRREARRQTAAPLAHLLRFPVRHRAETETTPRAVA